MSVQRKDITFSAIPHIMEVISDITRLDICSCPPVSLLCPPLTTERDSEIGVEDSQEDLPLPVPPALNTLLSTRIQSLVMSNTPVSVLLLHVSQLEDIHITPDIQVVHKRKRYHPSEGVIEQILANVRRAIRTEDDLYLDRGKGAAILFPNVDQQGAHTILERVYSNVSLLQGETIIPPLMYETDIVLSVISYPVQGQPSEERNTRTRLVTKHLTLRPAITPHLWDTMPSSGSTLRLLDREDSDAVLQDDMSIETVASSSNAPDAGGHATAPQDATSVPFLQLPSTLSKRLTGLLSYKVAMQFRCVPVGRDHRRLTVAMANPKDENAISALHKRTGMSIFPVACDEEALDALLAEQW